MNYKGGKRTMRSGEIVDRFLHFTKAKFYSGGISERWKLSRQLVIKELFSKSNVNRTFTV